MHSSRALGAPTKNEDLPNFDRRLPIFTRAQSISTNVAGAVAPAHSNSAPGATLTEQIKDVHVDRDEIVGSPAFIRSNNEFLTGPGGTGVAGVSPALVAKSANDRNRAAKVFIEGNRPLFGHGADILAKARMTRDSVTSHSGLRTVAWQQELDGLQIFEATLVANLTSQGELINIASHLISDPEAAAPDHAAQFAQPALSAQDAIVIAATNIGEPLLKAALTPTDDPKGAEQKQHFQATQLNDAVTRKVWLPMDASTLKLCWEVLLTGKTRSRLFRLVVDATTGEPLVRHCLTSDIGTATYRVFVGDSPSPMSPGFSTLSTGQPSQSPRTLVTLSALNTTASPNGWIDDGVTETRGNNVDAHTDLNDSDSPDLPHPQSSGTERVFDPSLDLTRDPSTYRDAAVVNLFYWCNWMHDKLYELGFDEAAGNFQNDNFSRGGIGNDAVQADAQDGAAILDANHINDASFSTPPDGEPGRMQMYLFTGPSPHRDSDLDTEIILHEYAHGLSNRLVGGGVGISQPATNGLAEGWSDFYALALLSQASDDVNGNYPIGAYSAYMVGGNFAQNYYYGLRRYPYSINLTKNPLTFKDTDPEQASPHTGIPISTIVDNVADETHNLGEVWCVTLWEARANLITKYGFNIGNQLILQLVTDGMKLSPANPNFIQARDAILQADLNKTGGANQALLWSAFAKRGMGVSATAPNSWTTIRVVESFALPDPLSITPKAKFTTGGSPGGPFTTNSKTFTLTNYGTAALAWTASKTQPWTTLDITSGTLAVGASATVTVTINNNADSLALGTYNDSITFTNTTSGVSLNRDIIFTVTIPPTILYISANVTDYVSNSFSFYVRANGTGTLTYQWRKDGVDLVDDQRIYGTTSDTVWISRALMSDSGLYTVSVSNGAPTVSTPVTVTINMPPMPVFIRQPSSQSVFTTNTLGLSANVSSATEASYQWQKNGVNLTDGGPISGTTSYDLEISNTQPSDAGQYTVVVSNITGSITSDPATITVTGPPLPTIITQPPSKTAYIADDTDLVISVNSETKASFQWQKDGVNLADNGQVSGANSSMLHIHGIRASDAGQYMVIVSNISGAITSNAAALTVTLPPLPSIYNQVPSNSSVYAGETIRVSVFATTNGPATYQWQKDGANLANDTRISGATTQFLYISSSQPSDAGLYTAIVTNAGGSTTSKAIPVMILIPAPPIITSQPVSVAVKDGDSFSLYVAASGDGELSCQWQKDGVNLARATSTSLNISFSRMSDAGSYTAVISNAGGSVTSNSATVTITPPPPPTIDNQPSSASTASGSTAYFSVHASGLDPMTYQWQKDGVKLVNDARISGAKTANLSITPAQFNDSGQYSVIVTNDGGSVTSSSVLLSVSITNPPVVYNQAPTFGAVDELFADLISASGDPASFSAAGLPPGITINAATGLIMGTPTTSGTYNVSFTASNAIGTSAAGSLTLTILPPTVSSTFAGKLGTSGAVDSTTTTAARFNTPAAIMSDATGILYIADTGNHTIRKIALSGEVTTFAGQAGISGSLDGTGLNAQFSAPAGLAVDNSNNLYVADTGNNVIRKITPAGQVSTLAGAAGIAGTADGIDSVARFNHPSALAIDSSNTLYIADTDNHTIRTIALNSSPVSVSTLVGQAGIQGAADGWPNSATLNFPISLAIDSNNNLYVADNGNHTIRRVTSVASLPTVGTLAGKTGITGAADGAGSEALFNAPAGLTMDRDNILYVADTSNHTIRMVTVDDSYNTRVTTLAGLPGASGGIDGAGDHARLNYPCGMTIDPSGAVYIADDNNHAVRRIQRMPFITFQPRTLTELAGTDTGVAVHALGVPTPTFQWYKDGVAVPGATSAILNFPNAQPAQTGTYRVTATNPLGTVTSNSATLTITGDNGSSSSSGSSSSGGSSSGPASSSSGPSSSGGGGGAPSVWFFLTLTAVALSKSAKRRRNG